MGPTVRALRVSAAGSNSPRNDPEFRSVVPTMEPDRALSRDTCVETDEVAALYARACPRLVGLLTAMCGSQGDAEEVAQDAFVRLLEHWGKVRDYGDPEAWLRTVAVRALVSRQRRRRVAVRGLAVLGRRAVTALPATEPAHDVELAEALAGLPIDQRAVLVLHHLHDLSVAEVAELLHIPTGTVKSRLSRARAALAPLLTDEERSTT